MTRRPRVLFSFGPLSDTSSPYTRNLVGALGNRVEARTFSWRRLFSGWPDVLHVHWPDGIVRSTRPASSQLKGALGLLFLLLRKPLRIRVVWTVHNLTPHEELQGLPRMFVKRLQATADWRIYINESSENTAYRSNTILHGPIASPGPRARSTRREERVLFFGLVRRYKGIEQLIEAFRFADPVDAQLVIAGRASDPSYAAEITGAIDGVPNASFIPEFIPNDDLDRLISSSRVVVLPYRSIYNSGALLLALELGTHVLAPAGEATERLQIEFGTERISLFEGSLNPRQLLAAIVTAQAQPVGLPDMTRRAWSKAADAHVEVYRLVMES